MLVIHVRATLWTQRFSSPVAPDKRKLLPDYYPRSTTRGLCKIYTYRIINY